MPVLLASTLFSSNTLAVLFVVLLIAWLLTRGDAGLVFARDGSITLVVIVLVLLLLFYR